MKQKKIVLEDYIDPETKMRFIEDDRGNRYYVPSQQGNHEITIIIENSEQLEKENKRLRRILEKLRMENNWLWEIIHTALREAKKFSPKKALENLEKAIKERTR